MSNNFANPTLTINDVVIPGVLPNTTRTNFGLGEDTVRATIGGGVNTTRNVETEISMISIDVTNRPDIIRQLKTWKSQRGNLVVGLAESFSDGTDISVTMRQATLVNNPELTIAHDGQMTLEFQGAPMPIS